MDNYPSPSDISYDEDSRWCQEHGHTGLLVGDCEICNRLIRADPRFAVALRGGRGQDGSRAVQIPPSAGSDPSWPEIERALEAHVTNGYIRSYEFTCGTYKVRMPNGQTAELARRVRSCCSATASSQPLRH